MVADAKGGKAGADPASGKAAPEGGESQETGSETSFAFKDRSEFDNVLNSAVTKRLKPLTKTIEELKGLVETLTNRGDQTEEGGESAEAEGDGKQKPGANGGARKPDPEVARLRKELDRQKQELETERTKARASKTRQAIKEAAIAAGFTDTADVVYNQFRDAATIGDDDEVKIGEKNIADALKEFAGTPTGKRLLPPKEAGGTGARAGGGAPGKPGDRPKDFEQKAVKAILTGAL